MKGEWKMDNLVFDERGQQPETHVPLQVIHGFVLRMGSMERCTITKKRTAGVTWIGFSSRIYTLSDSKKLQEVNIIGRGYR